MFIDCIEDMFKYKNYTWFAQNLGGFDAVFLLKSIIAEYSETKVQFKDSKPLSIIIPKTIKNKTKEGGKVLKIIFKDSLKLLPLSLKQLIKGFEITTQKLNFPYKFMKTSNLNYVGVLPDISYYNNISDLDYNKLQEEFKDKD